MVRVVPDNDVQGAAGWSNDGTRLLLSECYAPPVDSTTECVARFVVAAADGNGPVVEIDVEAGGLGGPGGTSARLGARRHVDPVDPARPHRLTGLESPALGPFDRPLPTGAVGRSWGLLLATPRPLTIARRPSVLAAAGGSAGGRVHTTLGWLTRRDAIGPRQHRSRIVAAMIRTSPFHKRTNALNETGLWSHWSGHLAAHRYQMSDKFEYFAVRNAAGVFDSSPLYKYRIHGRDAERFLSGVLARDIRALRSGQCPVHGVVRRPRLRRRGRRHPAARRR